MSRICESWRTGSCPGRLYDYIDSGAYDEVTMHANTADLQAIRLRQRVMLDVSDRSLETSILGTPSAMPVVISPVGLAGLLAGGGNGEIFRRTGGKGGEHSLRPQHAVDCHHRGDPGGHRPRFLVPRHALEGPRRGTFADVSGRDGRLLGANRHRRLASPVPAPQEHQEWSELSPAPDYAALVAIRGQTRMGAANTCDTTSADLRQSGRRDRQMRHP